MCNLGLVEREGANGSSQGLLLCGGDCDAVPCRLRVDAGAGVGHGSVDDRGAWPSS